nr:MAG TPA: Protein of unknown function (DUF2616) [Caudoviricetes sp.]DAZ55490.1 MAG TPA: Protein of unknown function (DUF2616) [Caudoviricetes sp.]
MAYFSLLSICYYTTNHVVFQHEKSYINYEKRID